MNNCQRENPTKGVLKRELSSNKIEKMKKTNYEEIYMKVK